MTIEAQSPSAQAPLELYASAKLPTQHGQMRIHVFREHLGEGDFKEHVALVAGEVRGQTDVLVRVHSECITSEVFGSLKCDCREQLDAAFARIAECGQGVVLYLRQEGRGIGLGNKIRAYALQAQGMDTVDANHALGFQDDLRDYGVAARMIEALGIAGVRLLTNNPRKVDGLARHGVVVTERVPHEIRPNRFNGSYLKTKAAKSGHLFSLPEILKFAS